MKKHKNKIIAGVIIFAVLVFVFWWGGNAPGLGGWRTPTPEATTEVSKTPRPKLKAVRETPSPSDDTETAPPLEDKPQNEDDTPMTAEEKIEWAEQIAEETFSDEEEYGEYFEENGVPVDEPDGSDTYHTEPLPQSRPVPIENAVISDKKLTCTLSVRCDTILNHITWLDKEKRGLVPENGVIFAEQTVTFYDGESVFNLLMREMKQNKIHMEYENTPVYNSAYIEGINNIYEFDCGELSGWMYKVNDWFPSYGCSRYQLQEGDKVEVLYTCDLGIDVGGYYAKRNGRQSE